MPTEIKSPPKKKKYQGQQVKPPVPTRDVQHMPPKPSVNYSTNKRVKPGEPGPKSLVWGPKTSAKTVKPGDGSSTSANTQRPPKKTLTMEDRYNNLKQGVEGPRTRDNLNKSISELQKLSKYSKKQKKMV